MNQFIFYLLTLISVSLYGNIPFKISETLHYKASFSGVNAARGTLKVVNKEKLNNIMTYHVQFTAKSLGIVDHLFPINDKIDIWLSEDSLLTIKSSSNIQEGKYQYSQDIIIDHKTGIAYSNQDTFFVKTKTHSPYALFYYFRKMDLIELHGKTINTLQKKKISELDIAIKENIYVEVPAGKYLCTEVTPLKKNKKQFKNEAKMSILFSNDDYKYPIKIWLNLKFGSLVLELDQISNEITSQHLEK